MMRWIQRAFFFLLGFFYVFNAYALTYDVVQARTKLAQYQNKIFKNSMSLSTLKADLQSVEQLQLESDKCIKISVKDLNVLNQLLENVQEKNFSDEKNVEFTKLKDQQLALSKQVAVCRLYAYHFSVVGKSYKTTIQEIETSRLMKKSAPTWELFDAGIWGALSSISILNILDNMDIDAISMPFLIALFFGLIFSVVCSYRCHGRLKDTFVHSAETKLAKRSFFATMSEFSFPIMLLLISNVLIFFAFFGKTPKPPIELILHALLIYTIIVAFTRFVFSPPYDLPSPLVKRVFVAKAIYHRVMIVATLLLVGYVTTTLFVKVSLDPRVIQLIRTLYVTLLGASTIWLCLVVNRMRVIRENFIALSIFITIILFLVLAAIIVSEWLGYHMLATTIINRMLMTISIVIATWLILKVISGAIGFINAGRHILSILIKRFFVVLQHRPISELLVLKFAVYVITLSMATFFLLTAWSVSPLYVDQLYQWIMKGFIVSHVTVVPFKIIIALFVFVFLQLIGRAFAASFSRRAQFSDQKDTQVAISSLTLYASFVVSLIITLVVAGVNFTGLAIVAGALSVGVGLGLQAIVSNFVSGLILLIEKPIKVGDRIVVGDTDGYVVKVRMRSTQITTMAKEDIIIPNADLITNRVTNYMFRNQLWRVKCAMTVKYGSDMELVKKVLLQVAMEHEEVIHEAPNEPLVLFRSFGDNGLLFELWAIIRDVNKKYRVESELNFAISKAFDENNIIVALPRRSIHFNQSPQ